MILAKGSPVYPRYCYRKDELIWYLRVINDEGLCGMNLKAAWGHVFIDLDRSLSPPHISPVGCFRTPEKKMFWCQRCFINLIAKRVNSQVLLSVTHHLDWRWISYCHCVFWKERNQRWYRSYFVSSHFSVSFKVPFQQAVRLSHMHMYVDRISALHKSQKMSPLFQILHINIIGLSAWASVKHFLNVNVKNIVMFRQSSGLISVSHATHSFPAKCQQPTPGESHPRGSDNGSFP